MAPGIPQNILDSEVDLGSLLHVAADGNTSPASAAEAFWIQGPVDLSRWNRLFPYQLLVLRAVADPSGKTSYQAEPGWQYTFPIPPEGISISTPYAISVSATQGGIVEEHGGAPFRIISLRGTTGVLPGRGRAEQQATPGFGTGFGIAGGTVAQLERTQSDLRSLASSIGVGPENPNLHLFREFELTDEATGPNAFVAKSTGYYQLRRLEYFLEAYVATKKKKAGRDLRLALAIWKKEAVYLVTPAAFDFSKSGEGGLEEPFNLQFKAWKRVRLDAAGFRPVLPAPVRRDPSALARGLNTLTAGRRALQTFSKVAEAAVGDANGLFEVLRQASLLTKDLAGVGPAMGDLPDNLAKSALGAWIKQAGKELGGHTTITDAPTKRARVEAGKAASEIADMTASRSRASVGAVGSRGQVPVGLTAARARKLALEGHPASKPFQDPKANFDLMNGIDIGRLELSPALKIQIAAEIARVRAFRRRDFERQRDDIFAAAGRLATALGAGDTTYTDTYGLGVVPQLKEEPTDSDWEALYALNNILDHFDALAATSDGEPDATAERMEVMAGLARASGIAFKVPTSKFAVPFPYGATLEGLARTYLGDPLRWHEIAALNGLREPYIDEVGVDRPLLVNGADHQVVVSVADAATLYAGQTVWVWSDQAARTRRRVLGLRTVVNSVVVTLDGDPDIGMFKTAHAARLSSFLPDTVNSQQLVYIPSDREPIDDDAIVKDIPGINEFDPMVAAAGVDLLLDSNNDLVITPDGDGRYAAGLANVVQSVRVALSVQRGTLLFHPEFGLPIQIGASTADFDTTAVLSAVRRMFAEDTAVTRVDAIRVDKSGPTASISASITVAGSESPIPLRFSVDRGFSSSS